MKEDLEAQAAVYLQRLYEARTASDAHAKAAANNKAAMDALRQTAQRLSESVGANIRTRAFQPKNAKYGESVVVTWVSKDLTFVKAVNSQGEIRP